MYNVIGRHSIALACNGKLLEYNYASESDMKFTAWVSGENIWTDGTSFYHSFASSTSPAQNMYFNKPEGKWEEFKFKSYTFDYFHAYCVWHDTLGNIYYSNGTISYPSKQLKFVPSTRSWTLTSFTGVSVPDGRYVWSDGTNTYYGKGSAQYVLNPSTRVWSKVTWNIGEIDGSKVWTDNGTCYYRSNNVNYKLDTATGTWIEVSFYVWPKSNIWHDHLGNTYASVLMGSGDIVQRRLDRQTNSWVDTEFHGLEIKAANHIWNDGVNTYYSHGTRQYVLDVQTYTWTKVSYLAPYRGLFAQRIFEHGGYYYFIAGYYGAIPALRETGPVEYRYNVSNNTWEAYEWNVYPIYGVWEHNGVKYGTLSHAIGVSDRPYYLDDTTMEWKPMTWVGLPHADSPLHRGIWKDSDGTVYYSDRYDGANEQYKLVSSNTWQSVSWGSNYPREGEDVWHEGDNVYYSGTSTWQYYLDRSSMTWQDKSWFFPAYSSGTISDVIGKHIWHFNGNTYLSFGRRSYKLSVPNSTWEPMTWAGVESVYGNGIWISPDNKCYYTNLGDLPIELH